MANMSYCRFYNTNEDLKDCLSAIESGEELSNAEMDSCKDMFRSFINFCCDNGIIEDKDGELDERLEEFFNKIGKPEYW